MKKKSTKKVEVKEVKDKFEKEKKIFNNMTEDEKYLAVLEKLYEKDKTINKGETQEESAKYLCDVNGLKKTYLNPNFKATLDYFNTIPKKKNFLSSLSEETSLTQKDEEIEEIERYEQVEEIPNIKTNEKLKIKIVLTENVRDEKGKTLRKVLSPFISTFKVGDTKMGMIHAAIAIGPWYLEWTNLGLVVPKKCFSKSAMMVLDVDNNLELADYETIINSIAEVVARWNCVHQYDKFHKNCQTFVDDILNSIGVDTEKKYKGSLGNYLKKLRTKGECETEYEIPKEIREKCDFKENVVHFQTHKQLDEFLKEIMKSYPDFLQNTKFSEDVALLKGFDRAFWLKHYQNKFDDISKCLTIEGDCACPFNDPQMTKSFGSNDWSEDVIMKMDEEENLMILQKVKKEE